MNNENRLGFEIDVSSSQAIKSLKNFQKYTSDNTKKTSKLTSEFNKAQKSIGKLNNKYNNINKDMNRSSIAMNNSISALSKLSKIGVTGVALKMLATRLGGTINSALEMIEITNLYNVAMGDMSTSTDKFLTKMSELSGLDKTNLQQVVATYSMLARSMGMSSKQSSVLSENMVKLAVDLSSLTNVPIAQVYGDLKSGLVGQSETVYKYGLDVTEAGIKQEAFAQGITKSVRNMTQGEKMALRYSAMIKQSGLAHGDFAKTINTPANQLRILGERFVTLTRTIGTVFIPILSAVLPYINAIIESATRGVAALAKLFGYKGDSIVDNMGGGLGNLNEEVGELNDDVVNLKKNLAGFDQVNILSENKTSSSDNGTMLDDLPLVTYDNKLDNLDNGSNSLNLFAGISEKLKNILPPVGDALVRLNEAFMPFKDNIGQGLQWLYENVLLPISAFTIGAIVPAFLDLLSGAINVLNPLINALKPLALWLWDSFLQPIAKWTGGVAITVLNGISSALNVIGGWIKNNQEAVRIITIAVGAFFLAWKTTELLAFIQMSGGIASALTLMTTKIGACTVAKIADKLETIAINALYAKDFIVNMARSTAALVTQAAQWVINTGLKVADTVATTAMTVATTAWNVVCGIATVVTTAFGVAIAFLTSPIGLVILAIAAIIAIVVLLIKNWDSVKEVAVNVFTAIRDFIASACTSIGNFFKGMWTGIKNVFSAAGGFFTNAFTSAFNGIKTSFSTVGSFFSKIWTGIKNTFAGVANWFGNIFSTAWKKVKDVFSVGGKIFDGIKDGILSALKAVINGLIGGINSVIAIPFNGINWALKKLKGISIMGIEPFGWVKTFDIPEIPKLARGGVVDDTTIAMIGEAGKEVVMPLERNTGWISNLANDIVSVGGMGGNGDVSKLISLLEKNINNNDIILYIGEEEVARASNKGNIALNRRYGVSLG